MKILAEIDFEWGDVVLWLSRGNGGCRYIGEISGCVSLLAHGGKWCVCVDNEEHSQMIIADLIQKGD